MWRCVNGSLLQQLRLFVFMSFLCSVFHVLIPDFNPVVGHNDCELGAEEYFYTHISFRILCTLSCFIVGLYLSIFNCLLFIVVSWLLQR